MEWDERRLEREVEADKRIDFISKAEGRLLGSFCESECICLFGSTLSNWRTRRVRTEGKREGREGIYVSIKLMKAERAKTGYSERVR